MNLRFRKNGTFRVLQMADIQDGPDVNEDTIRLIRAAIAEGDPDLIVLTGDQIRGYDPAYIDTFLRRRDDEPGEHIRSVTKLEARVRGITPMDESGPDVDADAADHQALLAAAMAATRQKVRRTFASFLSPAIEAHVPFAATYGNHDFQCGILVDEQDDMYREFDGCLNPKVAADPNPNVDSNTSAGTTANTNPLTCEPGTFALPIAASDGSDRIAMSVMMVNSGDYAGKAGDEDGEPASYMEGTPQALHSFTHELYARHSRTIDLADSAGYGSPSPEALQWLGDVQHHLSEANGDNAPVPSIVFQHIPPQEFYRCLRQVPAWTPNAVEGTRAFAHRCYVIDESICRPGAILGESIGCPDEDCGEVDTMRNAGGYFALFTGHDHKNAFIGHVDGMDLGYAPTCGFESYGPKSALRGIRLFVFHEDDPAAYDSRMLTFGELIGRHSNNELRVFIGDHLMTDGASVRNQLRRPKVFTAALLTAATTAHVVWHDVIRRLWRR
ncbi:metallophosphoesterase [Bifidobacterium tissieri]|uniref:Serine/threonine protein phosphatase n=1 Tax=Bifidobacterium tissieri TaxID=1630162 RepID=A0A5M9ZNP9_9BIFI|nr:metallophosphoesterase [Bifidobacterium tissieri]KAA8829276.1 serine/threonine protein phosphatase [Bifidobacterium tissieri]KAA8831880.1 serine/threonine protein phosphatase [Bifidobacterium tissieri]